MFDAVGVPSFRRSFGLLAPAGVLVTYGTFALAQALPRRTPLRFLRFGHELLESGRVCGQQVVLFGAVAPPA